MNTQRELGRKLSGSLLYGVVCIKEQELIPVFILYGREGNAVCICHIDRRGCSNRKCQQDVVIRDKYRGWLRTLYRDKYGK